MAWETPATLSTTAFSKFCHVTRFVSRPMPIAKEDATSNAIWLAPESDSSPNTLTTDAISPTSIISGTHDNQIVGRCDELESMMLMSTL